VPTRHAEDACHTSTGKDDGGGATQMSQWFCQMAMTTDPFVEDVGQVYMPEEEDPGHLLDYQADGRIPFDPVQQIM